MDFEEYQDQAWVFDQHQDDPERALTIALLGLGGEVGTLQTNQKKVVRDGPLHTDHRALAVEDLGDILWYVADTATWLGVSLAEVAAANLTKITGRWPKRPRPRPTIASPVSPLLGPTSPAGQLSLGPAHVFDGQQEASSERLPWTLVVDIAHSPVSPARGLPLRVVPVHDGRPCGDPLGDNAYQEDGYRFHDAFHLAYLAVLGWSPVQRALLRRKRKTTPLIDDVEDGGRAIAIEEGIAAFVFEAAGHVHYFDGVGHVDSDILRLCRQLTAHLEVCVCTAIEWEQAILQGFQVWRLLRQHGHGRVSCDLDARMVTARPLTESERREHAEACHRALHAVDSTNAHTG